jgi:hypothetical protein
VVTLALTARGSSLVEGLAPRIINFWNELLSDFTHAEVDTLIQLLTRLLIATEGKLRGDKPSRLLVSNVPISVPVSSKAKKP